MRILTRYVCIELWQLEAAMHADENCSCRNKEGRSWDGADDSFKPYVGARKMLGLVQLLSPIVMSR